MRSDNPHIVVIGGGTGVSILLRGLKKKTDNISAIITVGDDGGGSGRLREDLGMLPPGDIRACILALANTEPSMERLLAFRFQNGELKGQSIGNLFLAALDQMYGDFERAVKEACNVLAVTGRVYPVTINHMNIEAHLKNGDIVIGESKIPEVVKASGSSIDRVAIGPRKLKPLGDAIRAIESADLIVLGPGSLYTSLIPNLLVDGVTRSIANASAKKVYICNVMTQPGETDDYSMADHLRAIERHSQRGMIDYIVGNDRIINDDIIEKYRKDGSRQVLVTAEDEEYFKNAGVKLLRGEFSDYSNSYIVHDNMALSELLYELAQETKKYV